MEEGRVKGRESLQACSCFRTGEVTGVSVFYPFPPPVFFFLLLLFWGPRVPVVVHL